MKTIRLLILIATGAAMLAFPACKKLVEVNPPVTSVNGANVYTTDATAIAAVTGIYTNLSAANLTSGSPASTTLLCGLSADEYTLIKNSGNPVLINYYNNDLSGNDVTGSDFWPQLYSSIYVANAAISGLEGATTLTPAIRQQLLGEAYFVRAFCYFYLVNLYGDVPLVTGTDYLINSSLPRTPKKLVWQQLITDLQHAQGLLSPNYLNSTLLSTTTDRVRPSKWAATALLARASLYYADIENDQASLSRADSAATAVIANTALFSLSPLNDVFLQAGLNNNNEPIWQLQPVVAGQNSWDALFFIPPSSGPSAFYPVYLSNYLLAKFETGDQRLADWTGNVSVNGVTYYYPYKYKVNTPGQPVTEYIMVLRLAEQYLIRAEAEINTDPAQALADLNVIRTRAGLVDYAGATDAVSLQAAILNERQVEFFAEWGHRWLDLKRTGTVDAVMGAGGVCAAKGGTWNTDWQLYPVPDADLQSNSKLVQNPGY